MKMKNEQCKITIQSLAKRKKKSTGFKLQFQGSLHCTLKPVTCNLQPATNLFCT